MTTTWILVAERSRARIFALATPLAPLEELEDLLHSASRLKESELVSDQPGKMPDKGQPGQHAAPAAHSATEKEGEHFARQLSQRLEQGRDQHLFARLVIAAAPEFLGVLRRHMSDSLKALVAAEVHNNLVREPIEEIRRHLPPTIAR